jgi:hypothetical protein
LTLLFSELKQRSELSLTNDLISSQQEHLAFTYSCFDRVIIRGYIRNLFCMGGVVNLLRSLGFKTLSPGVLRTLTDQLNAHIEKVSSKEDIPIHWWPGLKGGKNGDKLRFVENRYKSGYDGTGNHVYCILTNRETVKTVASRTIERQGLSPYQQLYTVKKQVKQYYIYVHDAVLGGPCYLKISSYLPFQCEFYFNGHNYIRLNLDKQNISYRMNGNAFTQADDAESINALGSQVTGALVSERIAYWMGMFFKFDKGRYSTVSKYLKHEWYNAQVEVCSNLVFKSATYSRRLFNRLLDKYSSIGSPEYLCKIFKLRKRKDTKTKSYKKGYASLAVVKHWIRGNAIKMYNKLGYFIRIETTINHPKSLGHRKLKKPVHYLQAYLWSGIESNNRYQDICSEVDVSSVYNEEGQKYTERILVKAHYRSHDFRLRELLSKITPEYRNSAEIRYEMRKLLVRGIVEKCQGANYYRVTKTGYKWLWVSIISERKFVSPLKSMFYKNTKIENPDQLSEMERAYRMFNDALSIINKEFRLVA